MGKEFSTGCQAIWLENSSNENCCSRCIDSGHIAHILSIHRNPLIENGERMGMLCKCILFIYQKQSKHEFAICPCKKIAFLNWIWKYNSQFSKTFEFSLLGLPVFWILENETPIFHFLCTIFHVIIFVPCLQIALMWVEFVFTLLGLK